MFDGHDFSSAMIVYMVLFNMVSCSITGLRLWLWLDAKWHPIGIHLAPDAACIAGAVVGALISWAIV